MTRTRGLVLLACAALYGALVVYVAEAPDRDDRMASAGTTAAGTADEEEPAPVSATILIGRAGPTGTYSTPKVTISQDGQLSVYNGDTYAHTVTSEATGPDGKPLFDVVVPPDSTRAIPKATGLKAGDYGIYCRYHPNMRGTLTVTGGTGGTGGSKQKFTLPLAVPPTVRDAHVRLDMRRTEARMLPDGRLTEAWTYGGSWPGPTIRRPTGTPTRVTVANRLPREAGSMTMHLHGGHHESRYDGQPTTFLVPRGGSRTYRYDMTEQGKPIPGSFFWYHDHRMDQTTRNNWMGLQGMFIVEDPAEKRLDLPTGARDLPLMISDRSFTKRNQLQSILTPTMDHGHHGDDTESPGGMRFTGPHAPPNDANVGTQILVNGRFAPHHEVAPARYRLRLLNSSAFSSYNLTLSDGRPFVQLGTGDGLLPAPVVRQSILLGPAQRADVIVDFNGESGQNVVLQTVPRTDSETGTGSRIGQLMQFRVRGKARDLTSIPTRLPSPDLVEVPDEVTKTWEFSLEGDEESGTYWAINGQAYDADRIDHEVKLGSVEAWRMTNTSEITHYVHLHQQMWRTVSRNGQPPPAWERGLEDTWKLDPGEEIVVAARFTDYTGPFMVHCHMLDHEDHGMMATFEVVP